MNKEISLRSFLVVLALLIIFEVLILCVIIPAHNRKELESHCKVAVCNETNTICYNYSEKGDDTIVTWRGSCAKLK